MNKWLRKFSGWFLFGLAIGALWVLIRRLEELSAPVEAEPVAEIPVPAAEGSLPATSDPLASVAESLAASGLVASPTRSKKRAPATPSDDLTKLWGIGPKIAGLLSESGIRTYAQLAQASPAQLQAILQSGGVPPARFESWPAQAQLAAQGDWQALAAMIEQLKKKS